MSAVASDQSRINNQSKNNNKNITLITMDSSLDISGESMFPTPRHDTSPVREGRQTLSESRRSPAYDGLSAYRRSPSPALEEARTKEQIRQLKSQVKQLQTENNAEMETSAQLRRRINQLERDKVELTSTSNDETSKLQSQVAKLRSQVEKGEAIKQTLEYELTLAKKNVSQEQRLAADREMDLNSVIAANKERVAVLCDEVEDLQRKLERNMTSTSDEAHKLRKIIDEKDAVIAKCYAEQDYLQAEKDRLEIVIQEKDGETDDAEQKISSLEMERNTQSETVRRQLGDLEYAAEKEDRLKKDLEVAVNRIKSLEENIEAERAAHLESKFNSEIVQLRVRDLEGALEVEKSARSESTVNADLLNSQLRELESLYEEERKNAKNLKAQLDKVSKEYETVKKQLTHEIDDKSSMISNLSKQLELHQKNFNELKDELNKAKKRQVYLEETYGGSMRELELLLHNFQVDGKKKSATAVRKAHKDKPLTPSLVLETLRHTLMDYQNRLDATSTELSKMKTLCEKLTAECDSYKEMTWSRNKTVEQVQKRLNTTNKELERVRSEFSESETKVAALKVDLQRAKNSSEKNKNKVQELNEEMSRIVKYQRNDEENKRIFLHGLYQRIIAGRVVFDKSEPSVSKFTWDDLSTTVQEQVSSMMTSMNRTQEQADQAWEKLRHTGTLREGLESECVEMRNMLSQLQHEHSALLSTCALLIGALIPLYNRASALTNQRNLLEEQISHCDDFKRQARVLVETLSQELECTDEKPLESEQRRRHPALTFRSGAIAVMAANRLNHFVRSSKQLFTSYDLPGNMTSTIVCVTGVEDTQTKFTGVGLESSHSESGTENKTIDWLTNPELLRNILDSVSDLQELVNKTSIDGFCIVYSALHEMLIKIDKPFDQKLEATSATIQHTVPSERFDTICQELSNALQREQQAQELLNEQSSQLEELSLRLNELTTEDLERNVTINEAVKNLSEAKMELRRKEQSLRQLNRHLSQLESDKKQMHESVFDAENSIRQAARLLVMKPSFELKICLNMFCSDNLMPSELGDGMKMGPAMLASQSVVAAVTDIEQALMSRVSVLENEITSNKKHVETLKKELSAACKREYEEVDFLGNERPRFDRNGYEMPSERSFGKPRPLYEPDRSYMEDFAPLREEVDQSAYSARKTVSPRHHYRSMSQPSSRSALHLSPSPRRPTRRRLSHEFPYAGGN
ncbi:coiled-coil domain-containing protein 171-like [Saccoglossus kowalevskii]|uniref:Coiled-coil domain-containing protein 171-like n=1 Tax=Saccoglossus kowalevskii TaxID=10224 RepID=A0ABM0GIZ8_SACKO|nr:PREDICTED: coiled-coil domain-containing protein 171-like [Saccoglossus kowalevskii]